MMNSVRVCLGLWLAFCGQTHCAAEGLQPAAPTSAWPQWQARLVLPFTLSNRWRWPDASDAAARGSAPAGAMLGDYFFDRSALEIGNGQGILRATSGILFGQRSSLSLRPQAYPSWHDSPSSAPYVGIGYSGWSLKGGWEFSADLGMVADLAATATRPNRPLLGSQGIDAGWRELRLAPMLQLGVSYAF